MRPVAGIGPENPDWVILGEGPGENERASGRPFIGASGRLLDRILSVVGAERDKLWITNTMCCTPAAATPAQKKKAAECCAPRLDRELDQFAGKPIWTVGGIAAQRLLGDKFSISQLAGSCHDVGSHTVIPSIHPAAILRGGGDAGGGAHATDLLYWQLCYDAGKIHHLSQGKLVRFSEDVEFEGFSPTRAEHLIEGMVKEAFAAGEFACDTETDSKRATTANLKAIGVATTKRAVCVAWKVMTPRAKELLRGLFSDPTLTCVLQNGLYDRPVLKRHGLELATKIDDTLLLHHSAFPGLPHDLQRMTTQFFAAPAWKSEFRGGGRIWDAAKDQENEDYVKWRTRLEELLRYCAMDTLTTARLPRPLRECLTRYDAWETYREDVEMADVANQMQEWGVPLDRERNRLLQIYFQVRIEKSRALIEDKAKDPEIQERLLDYLAMEMAKWGVRKAKGRGDGKNKSNRKADPEDFLSRHAVRLLELRDEVARGKWQWKINAPPHVAAYLKARRVPLFRETKKGRISVNEEVLEKLRYLPEVGALLSYREDQKAQSTFVKKYARSVQADGRMRPAISVIKITGRWATTDPATMNVTKGSPKWDKGEKKTWENWLRKWMAPDGTLLDLDAAGFPNLRWQVVAEPGHKLVGFDLSALEGRIIALLSGDEFLLDVFSHEPVKYGPGDLHSRFARLVWKDYDDVPEHKRDKLRDFIKRTGYGALYGGSVETLWFNLLKDDPKVKKQDVALVVNVIQRQLRGVASWHQELLRQVIMPPHELRSLFGRRRVFPLGNCSPTDAYNFTVQATGAGIMGRGLKAYMPRRPDGVELNLQIHDACVFHTPEALVEENKVLVKDSFEQTITHKGNRMHFPIDLKVGNDWACV